MILAQLAGRTRLDLPLMLGTIATEDPDRARVAGFAIHLAIGQVFALFYAAGFAALDRSEWWLGAIFGLAHAAVALTVLVPLLPGVHPRMASERAGPDSTAVLEPPGLFALNYGTATPLVAVGAHVVYGAVLGLFLGSELMSRPGADRRLRAHRRHPFGRARRARRFDRLVVRPPLRRPAAVRTARRRRRGRLVLGRARRDAPRPCAAPTGPTR